MRIKVKDQNLYENLNEIQKSLIRNENIMSHPDPTKTYGENEKWADAEHAEIEKEAIEDGEIDQLAQHVFNTPKRQEEEKYREEKERTLEILNDGLHRRGYEIGGISTDELVDLIILNMDQGEVKFLIDRLVIRYGKTFGERLFE